MMNMNFGQKAKKDALNMQKNQEITVETLIQTAYDTVVRINENTEKEEKELRNKIEKDDDLDSPKETDKIKLLN
jgi:hypothetical protein